MANEKIKRAAALRDDLYLRGAVDVVAPPLCIEKELARGIATEQTYRSPLKALMKGLATGVAPTNEPRRIECGAPDFIVTGGLSHYRIC